MKNHNYKQKNNTFHIHFSDVVTLSCDNTLIFMYFTQNLLENWILGGNFPVNMPIWGPHGFLVGNWATGLCVGQFTGAQVGLACA